MEDSNMQSLEQESSQRIQFSTKDIKTEELFVYENKIKQEPTSNEASIYCLTGISYDNPTSDLDSFEDVTTKTFLSIEKEENVEGDPLEIQSVNIEDPFQVDDLFLSRINEDQGATIVPNNCSQRKSSADIKEETINQISATDKIIKKFSCIQCDYSSNTKANLTRHVDSVHKCLKPFDCSLCDYKCSLKSSLTTHVNAVHKALKPFDCSLCDYKCTSKAVLIKHLKAVHECIKPFRCSLCDYRCSGKSNLTMHVNGVHKGLKPFNCSNCDYKCTRKYNLVKHLSAVHKN